MAGPSGMIGEKLGSYRIEKVLGSGAMGVVYKGINDEKKIVAAIKVISADSMGKGKARERFEREAKILQQFRHPNIVRFLAVGRYQGTSYFAMEFVEGLTLDVILHKRGPLPWLEVVNIGIQICDALHFAHERGIVHRDLKPSNLMVTKDGRLKLTDFGIAKDLDATALTGTGRTLGTAAYMAPEQIRGTPEISHKTDLYALGVLLYQLLVNALPFEGPSAIVLMNKHVHEPAPKPSAKVEEIPVELDKLVVTLMSKSPTDRPWDAAAVAQSLTELREKFERGDHIPMVWEKVKDLNPSRTGAAGSSSAALGAASTTAGAEVKKPRKKRKKASESGLSRILILEVSLLLTALVLIGGAIGYFVWPPGADYLYRQADALMASDKRSDWLVAVDDFIDPLDRRFPNHPYRDKTRAWRDKILLDEADGRAVYLESEVKTKFSQPQNQVEERFVGFSSRAAAALKRGDKPAAAKTWDEFTTELSKTAEAPDARKWMLLANRRAEELKREVVHARELVAEQVLKARAAAMAGQAGEASDIQAALLKTYGADLSVRDLLIQAGIISNPPVAGELDRSGEPN